MRTDERKNKIGCIHPKAQEIIKRLQPYQRGGAFLVHPLWQLNQLSNVDKHRLPHIIQFATVAGAYFSDSSTRPRDRQIYMGLLKDGTRIATYSPPPDEPDEVVNPDFTFLEGLQFARTTYMLASEVLSTLRSIHSCIREDILPPLARYLPEPEWFNPTVQ